MIDELLKRHPLVTDQVDKTELRVILSLLDSVLKRDIPGDIVELGCYEGTTALFLQRVNKAHPGNRTLHVYDSFAGLPEKTKHDESPTGIQFKAGELRASKGQLITNFKRAGLPVPAIHKVWFGDLTSADMPQQIAFAFLDGDFYESIRDSLRAIEPHLSPGAVIVVDDYHTEALPGARVAVDEWAKKKGLPVTIQASLAVITTA